MSMLLRPSGILGRAVVSARSAAVLVNSSSSSSSNGRFMGTSTIMRTSTRHDNDPEVLEKNKQSILRKHSKDSTEDPHWHEEIASDSEAFVKSYRGEIDASEGEIAKIQNATKKILHAKTTNVKE